MTQIREGLPPIPRRWLRLPIEERGYPVPYFVGKLDGKWDFRIMDADKLHDAIRYRKCWLCGEQLGKFQTFVIGPMCAINRSSAEPPCHLDCARYAVRVCPFLTLPKAKRRESGLPEDRKSAGFMIKRNPGVTMLWTTKGYRVIRAQRGGDGILFNFHEPTDLEFYAEGREASLAEVMESITSGLDFLRDEVRRMGAAADLVALEMQIIEGLGLVTEFHPQTAPARARAIEC
jgi:hypothetical protein